MKCRKIPKGEPTAAHPCTAGEVAALSLTQLSSVYCLNTLILYRMCRDTGSNFAFVSSSGQEGAAGLPLRCYASGITALKCLEPSPCRGHQGMKQELGLNITVDEACTEPSAAAGPM